MRGMTVRRQVGRKDGRTSATAAYQLGSRHGARQADTEATMIGMLAVLIICLVQLRQIQGLFYHE